MVPSVPERSLKARALIGLTDILDTMENARRESDEAWRVCPGIPGGKEPECERAVAAAAATKTDAAAHRYLTAANDPFAAMIAQMQACNVKREAIVRDAKAANVVGANVKDVLRPLVAAWELVPYAAAQWTGICEDAQRYLQK